MPVNFASIDKIHNAVGALPKRDTAQSGWEHTPGDAAAGTQPAMRPPHCPIGFALGCFCIACEAQNVGRTFSGVDQGASTSKFTPVFGTLWRRSLLTPPPRSPRKKKSSTPHVFAAQAQRHFCCWKCFFFGEGPGPSLAHPPQKKYLVAKTENWL